MQKCYGENISGYSSSISVIVQIRNEKIRRLIGLFCNILKTVRKHQHSCLNTRKQFKQHSFQVFGVFDIFKVCERA